MTPDRVYFGFAGSPSGITSEASNPLRPYVLNPATHFLNHMYPPPSLLKQGGGVMH